MTKLLKVQVNHRFMAWKICIRKTGDLSQLSFTLMRKIVCLSAIKWENKFYCIYFNTGILELTISVSLLIVRKHYIYFLKEDREWEMVQWVKCLLHAGPKFNSP